MRPLKSSQCPLHPPSHLTLLHLHCKYQGTKLSPTPLFFKQNILGRVTRKNHLRLFKYRFFLSGSSFSSDWLGRKCFPHFESHNITTKQTPVVRKAGHILKTGVRRFQKGKQALQRHPQLIWSTDSPTG